MSTPFCIDAMIKQGHGDRHIASTLHFTIETILEHRKRLTGPRNLPLYHHRKENHR